ncbi:hypothetical protein SAMN05444392_12429 [Seinonella peptonophila]|uniref:Uncharacterized protein n=1 Tax=Seinonella peptonophila TaxID=112248 RepID=A0A1M5BJ23_9BACL|nr:hypothetical protein SAMN05444392_12429 [Seinonella peptonophila]
MMMEWMELIGRWLILTMGILGCAVGLVYLLDQG